MYISAGSTFFRTQQRRRGEALIRQRAVNQSHVSPFRFLWVVIIKRRQLFLETV